MGLTDSICGELGDVWHQFEEKFSASLTSGESLLDSINGYLLEKSGKKLRPMLALSSAGACGGAINDGAVTCAAVSELIHTATLLHDDVVDEGDFRRGAPTVRSLFSPGASVLMGDYWLSRAVALLVDMAEVRIISLFAHTIEALSSGEILQMECADSLKTTRGDYYKIIERKTASLFVSAAKSAAMAVGASEEKIEALGRYAYNLGMCFQIRDDILDYRSSSETGKDADSDIEERKITLPLLCAFGNAPSERERIIREMSGIDVTTPRCESNLRIVRSVRQFVTDNGGIQSAAGELRTFAEKAKGALATLDDTPYKNHLIRLADALVS